MKTTGKIVLIGMALGSIGAGMAGSAAAADDEGPWEVRLRALYLDPANKSDAIPGLAPADAIHINSKLLPDVDFEYHFTPNWSSELVLTYPQKQTVTRRRYANRQLSSSASSSYGEVQLPAPTRISNRTSAVGLNFTHYLGRGPRRAGRRPPGAGFDQRGSGRAGRLRTTGFPRTGTPMRISNGPSWDPIWTCPESGRFRPCTSIRCCSGSASVIGSRCQWWSGRASAGGSVPNCVARNRSPCSRMK